MIISVTRIWTHGFHASAHSCTARWMTLLCLVSCKKSWPPPTQRQFLGSKSNKARGKFINAPKYEQTATITRRGVCREPSSRAPIDHEHTISICTAQTKLSRSCSGQDPHAHPERNDLYITRERVV